MPIVLMYLIFALTGGASVASGIDFTEAFTSALNNIQSSFAALAAIAIGVGLAIWGAPKAIQLVKKFFTSLTH